MQLDSFRHKGLRQLYEGGDARGMVDKLRKLPGWKLHPLRGDLKGFWSLAVTGNWRLIFLYDRETNTAGDIGLADYH